MRSIFPESRCLRFTLFGFASITLLLAAGYFALVTAFPPARMVSLLAEHIKTATGRDFRINGDLSFRLLPTLAVVANDLVLSNADWGSRAEMLKLKRTAFEIALKPLLNGEIRVLKVGLEGADLLLETDQTGRSNWIFTEVQSPRVPAAIPAFDLEQLVISDANITYRDAVSGATRSVFVESFKLQTQDEFDLLATSLVFEQHKAQFDGRVGSLLALIAGAAEWPFDLQLKLNGNELSFNGKLGLKPKLRLDGQISSVTVNLEKWGKNNLGPVPAQPKSSALFSDSEFSLDVLPAFPFSLGFRIDQLLLLGKHRLSALHGQLKSEPGRVVVEPLSFAAAGGQFRGRVETASPTGGAIGIVLGFEAKGMSVESLEAMSGGGALHGGRADLKANLKLKGNSARKLAASATGEVLLSVADTRLEGGGAALERNLIVSLLQALIPGRSKQQDLTINCGVVHLPLVNGVAVVDRSIAMETEQIAISASGKVDFSAQNLVLAFSPQVKKGLGLNQSSLAHLVMLKGPLHNPEIVIDPKGTVFEMANIGVAVATGGASLLASRLLSEWENTSSCRTAVSGAPAKASQHVKRCWAGRGASWRHVLDQVLVLSVSSLVTALLTLATP